MFETKVVVRIAFLGTVKSGRDITVGGKTFFSVLTDSVFYNVFNSMMFSPHIKIRSYLYILNAFELKFCSYFYSFHRHLY